MNMCSSDHYVYGFVSVLCERVCVFVANSGLGSKGGDIICFYIITDFFPFSIFERNLSTCIGLFQLCYYNETV